MFSTTQCSDYLGLYNLHKFTLARSHLGYGDCTVLISLLYKRYCAVTELEKVTNMMVFLDCRCWHDIVLVATEKVIYALKECTLVPPNCGKLKRTYPRVLDNCLRFKRHGTV